MATKSTEEHGKINPVHHRDTESTEFLYVLFIAYNARIRALFINYILKIFPYSSVDFVAI